MKRILGNTEYLAGVCLADLLSGRRFRSLRRTLLRIALQVNGYLNYKSLKHTGEVNVMKLISRVTHQRGEENGVIVDGGCFDGAYSRLVRKFFLDALIISIDPNFSGWELPAPWISVSSAVGAENGNQMMYDYDSKSASEHASLINSNSECLKAFREVSVKTLDTLIQEYAPSRTIILVKLDLEGGEADAITGLKRTLRESPPMFLQVEIGGNGMYSGSTPESLRRLLPGYKQFRILSNGLEEFGTEDYEEKILCFSNLLFVRKDIEL